MANKLKMLYDQGTALMSPVDKEAEAIAQKKATINQYNDATVAKPTLVISAPPSKPAPNELVGKGPYGSQPGENRIDLGETSPAPVPNPREELMKQPLSYHAEGGELDPDKVNVVGENGPEEIVGDQVIPLDHTMRRSEKPRMAEEAEAGQGAPAEFGGPVYEKPEGMKSPKWDTESPDMPNQDAPMQLASNKPSPEIPKPVTSPRKADADAFVQGLPGTASPEERSKAAIETPNDGQMKPSKTLQAMDAASAGARQKQLSEPTPTPPDPNQVIADQHAKAMKAKLDAASKGDLVGMGAAIIAGNALPKPEVEGVPDVPLGPGAAAMPQYTGKARIGAGTPGEEQAKQDYQNKLTDLDQKILTASQVHTPEGKQELGYLQSEKSVLQKMNPLGSPANKPGVLGKIEHAAGTVGNVIGNAVLGENNMANIPGSAAALEKGNEEGAANVEQGSKEALTAAQADKAQQAPAVKPQEQLAQEKLNAQTKLGQLTTQMQDPNLAPEQKAALQQQAEQIYATNPEFRPKQEDQGKEAIGEDGAKQHTQQLDTMAQAAGFTPEQAAAQQTAYGVKPTDSAATAQKKLAEAESVAKLDSARRDRQTAQDAAANAKVDAKAAKTEEADTKRMDKSYQYNKSRMDKTRKPIDDMAMRLGRLKQTVSENTPLADALVAPELLTAMAGGAGSGLRMNEAEISRIVGGRGHWADLQAAINKWRLDPKAALSITPEQRKEIHALLDTSVKRVQRSTDILDEANTALTNAETPQEHRKILDDAQGKLSRAEIGKVKVEIPGHPPNTIDLDKLDAFKQKYPNGTVE